MKPSRWKGVTVVEEIGETEAGGVTAGSFKSSDTLQHLIVNRKV
jgi:hypothetical protein